MAFIDRKEELVKIILTQHGRKQLSKGKFAVRWFAFADDEVDYEVQSGIITGSGGTQGAEGGAPSPEPILINTNPITFDANTVSSSLEGDCAMWLRSDDTLVAGAGGSQVVQLNDKSIHNNPVCQTIASNRPTTTFSQFQDFPGAEFVSSDYFISDSTFFSITNSSGITVFAVIRTSPGEVGAHMLAELDTNHASADAFALAFHSNSADTATPSIGDTGGMSTFGSASIPAPGDILIVKVLYDRLGGGENQLTMSFNGGADETLVYGDNDDVDGDFTNAFLYMGSRAGSSLFYTGSLAEWIVYDHILSASAIADVETYLSSRYLAPITASSITGAASASVVGYALSGWSDLDYYSTRAGQGPRGGLGSQGTTERKMTMGVVFKPERLQTGVGERRTFAGTWTDGNCCGAFQMFLSGNYFIFGTGPNASLALLTSSYLMSAAHLNEVHTAMGVVEGTGDSSNSFKLYFDGNLVDQTAFTASGDSGIFRNSSDANNLGIYNPDLANPGVSPVSRSLESVLLLGYGHADGIALSASQVSDWHSGSRSNLRIQNFSGTTHLWDVADMANSASSKVPDSIWVDSVGGINQYITGTRLIIVEVDQ